MRPDPSPFARDARSLHALLGAGRRRLALALTGRAALAGGAAFLMGTVAVRFLMHDAGSWPRAAAAAGALLSAAAVVWRQRDAARLHRAAADAERLVPAFQNHRLPALELARFPGRASARITALVLARAARIADTVEPATLWPLTRAIVPLGAGIVLALAGMVVSMDAPAGTRGSVPPGGTARAATTAAIDRIEATVAPPSYAAGETAVLQDPARLEAVAGSRITLRIGSRAAAVGTEIDGAPIEVAAGAGGWREARFDVATTGVLTVAAIDEAGRVRDRRVMPVLARADAAPVVTLERPGTDLVFPDAARRVTFAARATDDLGLASLTLYYTKVSGAGEQYEFDEGELPWMVDRGADGAWRARTERALQELGLRPGDLLVYYARATDRRPGSAPAVSDSYVIEIGTPPAAASGGFAVPPDEERHAISLNALIRKTERVHAARGRMPAAAFADATAGLAVEQRMVRTETIFMMGSHGHVEDEEAEAAQAHEIQEGRLENHGQADLLAAVRLMTVAERELLARETGRALEAQRTALGALQRALSRQRYFLRTIPARSRIDAGRRGAGDLSAARSWTGTPQHPDSERAARVRTLLAELARVPAAPGETDISRLAALAPRLLALDPASPRLQQAARELETVSRSAPVRPEAVDRAVRRAAGALLGEAGAAPATAAPLPAVAPGLTGAFTDGLRASGGLR